MFESSGLSSSVSCACVLRPKSLLHSSVRLPVPATVLRSGIWLRRCLSPAVIALLRPSLFVGLRSLASTGGTPRDPLRRCGGSPSPARGGRCQHTGWPARPRLEEGATDREVAACTRRTCSRDVTPPRGTGARSLLGDGENRCLLSLAKSLAPAVWNHTGLEQRVDTTRVRTAQACLRQVRGEL